MSSGELNRRVIFMRRPTTESDAGNTRGKFDPLFLMWAGFTPLSSARRADYGYAEDVITGWLKLRECGNVASLTIADRVVFKADPLNEFEIDSVGIKDRTSGYRLLRIKRQI